MNPSYSDSAPISRRNALLKAGTLGVGAALSVAPLFAMAKSAQAAKFGPVNLGSNATPVDILNYALTLEYLEYFYYFRGVNEVSLTTADRPLFTTLRDHELAHVNLLRSAVQSLGGTPVFFEVGDFNFSALGFNPFSSPANFMALSQGLEDTGVRAYKGQAGALVGGGDLLTVALQIHSVEARHASAVRRLRGERGYIELAQTTEPRIAPVYAGEDNVTQGGVNLQQALAGRGYTLAQITGAFDEPFTMEQTLAIAGPLITGDGMA
jgi:hypothetical protein